MSDVELLFLVLALVYAWECACWVRGGTLCFRTWLGRRWRSICPSLLANQRGGFIFASPLPPLGALVQSTCFPLSVSPDGVLCFVAGHPLDVQRSWQAGHWIPFETRGSFAARQKQVVFGEEVLCRTASVLSARWIADQLNALKQLPHSQRTGAVESLYARAFDADRASKLWREFRTHTRPLRVFTNVAFVFIFCLMPAIVWLLGFRLAWPGLAMGLVGMSTAITVSFIRAHLRFAPELVDDRFTQAIIVALSPVTAIRASDLLSRYLLEQFHPLVLGHVFLRPAEFTPFANRALRGLLFPALPLCPHPSPNAQAAEQFSRTLLVQQATLFLRRHGVQTEALLKEPAKLDSSCRSYCPRCHAQFTVPEGSCKDCGGRSLVEFGRQAVAV
ncbi:MAG TPA: hypothetical protein VN673_14355 [Clostridia bacterium]|nr:hypothetical protein [Clostridia bacterium]